MATEKAPLASVNGWTNFLRKIWEAAPNKLFTAKVIVRMVGNVLETLRQTRQTIRDQNLFWAELSMHSWDNEFAELDKQMTEWKSAMASDPTDAVGTLIVPQIIFSTRQSGKQFVMPYSSRVVSLLNQIITQFEWTGRHVLEGGNLGWITDTLQEGSHEVFGQSAPGEEPTIRDNVAHVIDNAKENMGQFLDWAKKASKTAGLILLALAGLYVVTRARQHQTLRVQHTE